MSTSTPNNYAMIREILDGLGFSDWIIVERSPAIPDDDEYICILYKVAQPSMRAEFKLHNDLFQFGSQYYKLVLAIKKGLSEAKRI